MNLDYAKYVDFFRKCNEYVFNETEYAIVDILIRHISKLDEFTISDIAEEANISVSSVSRFIRKMGFKSFQDFRYSFEKGKSDYTNLVSMAALKSNFNSTSKDICDNLYHQVLTNINSTISQLDTRKLDTLIQMMMEATTISFLGDSREVRTFFTLQLDLMMFNKPVYAFTNRQIAEFSEQFKKENHLTIFFALKDDWVDEEWKSLLLEKKDTNKLVIVTQDDLDIEKKADLVVKYGVSGSRNLGYYSLSFLNDLLCSMLLQKKE